MKKTVLVVLGMALLPASLSAVDGTVLINQSSVMAAGGFPYIITQAGSYKLSGNLTVPDLNTNAIVAQVSYVTIDLNGFSIIGPVVCTGRPVTACTNDARGIGVAGLDNTTVVNGIVRGMRTGILLGFDAIVEKVHVISNIEGIVVNTGTVTGNSVSANISGIIVGIATVSGNTVNYNGGVGIQGQGTVSGNSVNSNGTGIFVGCPSSVVGNTSVGHIFGNLVTSGPGCAVANNAAL